MKRGFLLVAFFLAAGPLLAQDSNVVAAAAMADKQAVDERYERVTADVQALQAANEEQAKKISGLEDEIRQLRDQLSSQANNSSVQDDLKHLADKIQEVDRKREEDKAAITEQVRTSIAGLERALAGGGSGGGGSSVPSHPTPPRPVVNEKEPPVDVANGFAYTVKKGDSLSLILQAYNADFKSKGMKTISMRQASDANPNVNWNRLLVGQKIIIPRPAE